MMTTAREHALGISGAVSLLLSVEAARTVEGKGRCGWREVQHCRTGRCGRDRVCGAVRAAPLLTSRQGACRLECCIAAEAQRANQEWKLHTREESEVENRLSAALPFSELQTHRWVPLVRSTGLRVLGHWWVHGHGEKQISAHSAIWAKHSPIITGYGWLATKIQALEIRCCF